MIADVGARQEKICQMNVVPTQAEWKEYGLLGSEEEKLLFLLYKITLTMAGRVENHQYWIFHFKSSYSLYKGGKDFVSLRAK